MGLGWVMVGLGLGLPGFSVFSVVWRHPSLCYHFNPTQSSQSVPGRQRLHLYHQVTVVRTLTQLQRPRDHRGPAVWMGKPSRGLSSVHVSFRARLSPLLRALTPCCSPLAWQVSFLPGSSLIIARFWFQWHQFTSSTLKKTTGHR